MAMTKCKECKKDISDSADTCPHCGIKNPNITAGIKIVSSIMAIIVIIFFFSKCSDDSETATQTAAEKTKIALTASDVSAHTAKINRNDIVGQWRNVITNPAYKNTVSKRYMRHTFFEDGLLVVENKENSNSNKKWEFKDGIFIVSSSYKSSKFIEHYQLNSLDELLKIKFKSIIDGKPLADYNPKIKYIRQGSSTEKSMKTKDIFKSSRNAMDFIDPTTLEVGKKYILSKKTPIMSHYKTSESDLLTDLSKIIYAQKGQSISIEKREKIENTVWYQVKLGNFHGWVNSIALFGQNIK